MKIVIKYGNPITSGCYCYIELPVFESNPKIKYFWSEGPQFFDKSIYFAELIVNFSDLLRKSLSSFTLDEIRKINEGYFYLLDNPKYKEVKIQL